MADRELNVAGIADKVYLYQSKYGEPPACKTIRAVSTHSLSCSWVGFYEAVLFFPLLQHPCCWAPMACGVSGTPWGSQTTVVGS